MGKGGTNAGLRLYNRVMASRQIGRIVAFGVTVVLCGTLVFFALAVVASPDEPLGDEDIASEVFWSLPVLLALAGAVWPIHRGTTVGAIAAVCACAAALIAYFGLWTFSCPDCLQGDDHRTQVFDWTWKVIALASAAGISIIALAALLSSAVYNVKGFAGRRVP
jgi:hypothetical protein